MKRRTFIALAGLTAGAAAFAGPRGMKLLLAAEDTRHPHAPNIAHELDVARALGKPLLILVRPDPLAQGGEPDELWVRQNAFGAWIYHGRAKSMAQLALCHVTTAPLSEIRKELPHAVGAGDDVPWLVFVETGGMTPHTQTAGGMPPAPVVPVEEEEISWESLDAAKIAHVKHRSAQFDEWVREFLGDARLEERSVAALASLTSAERRQFELAVSSPTPTDRDVFLSAAAATLWHARNSNAASRQALTAQLAAASANHLRRNAPRGSHWAFTYGCGATIACDQPSGDASYGFDCGMGHVPEISQHFLQLLVEH